MIRCLVLCGLFLLNAGCGSSGIHPVRGRVVFPDGQPLSVGRVVIDVGESLTGSWGQIRSDGTFSMGTHQPDDGVPTGSYRVYINNAVLINLEKPDERPTQLVHPRFTNPETSGLKFDVPAQTNWEIVVERPDR